MILEALALSTALAVDAPAQKSSQTAETVTHEAPAEQLVSKNGDPLVCKRTKVVGSRFFKRMCLTQQDWENQESRGKDITGRMKRARASFKGG